MYRLGLLAALVSSILIGVSGAPYFAAYKQQPTLSLGVGSFIRVLCNCVFVFLLLLRSKDLRSLTGTKESNLFIWGILGAITTFAGFAATVYLGSGIAQLFQIVTIILITLLRPWFLAQKNSPRIWWILLGSTGGFLMLQRSLLGQVHPLGIVFAFVSSVSCAFAWIFATRAGRNNKPITIMSYWSICALLSHFLLLFFSKSEWPQTTTVWGYLLLTGVLVTLNQFFNMIAYQMAPAGPVAAMSYVAPAIALGLDSIVFHVTYSASTLWGSTLILFFGVLLPFAKNES